MEIIKGKNLDKSYYITWWVSSCRLEFADDDMFTNGFKMKVTDDGIFYEVEGNHVSKIEKKEQTKCRALLYQTRLRGFHHIS